MIIRWLIGHRGGHWREVAIACLELSQDLMRKFEPDAEFHVFYHTQDGCPPQRPDTHYHETSGRAVGVTWEKFIPPRLDIAQHEVFMDNDHMIYALPPQWAEFKASRDKALVWRTDDWGYHGSFTHKIRHFLSSGWWGLPPSVELKIQTGLLNPDGTPIDGANHDQEEMGAMSWAFENHFDDDHLLIVKGNAEGITYYIPEPHEPYSASRYWGKYGVHLTGANRGHWDPTETLAKIRREYL